MALFDAAKEGYELTEIDGRPVLFTNMRLNRDTVPAGIFCYDVRDSDALDGSMAEIKAVVVVNHWGTILCKDPFPVDEYGSYYPKDWGGISGNRQGTACRLSAAGSTADRTCYVEKFAIKRR